MPSNALSWSHPPNLLRMDIDVVSGLYAAWQTLSLFLQESLFVSVVKFLLFIYVIVLIADLVMLFMLQDIPANLKKTLFGGERPLMTRSAILKRWENILARLAQDNPSQYKVAILEADAFANEILLGIGYEGATMTEKIEGIQEGQLETKEALLAAHRVRNRIVHEADFSLSRAETKHVLDAYRRFFDEVELF